MARKTFATRVVGKTTVTALYDGFAMAPAATYVTATEGLSLANQWRVFRHTGKPLMRAHVLAFLVETGERKILIDAGAGRSIGPTMGAARKNLMAAGHDPLSIDSVLVSHPHPDHVGGIMAGDAMAYPNARVHLDRRDFAHWTAPEHTYRQLGAALAPYIEADRIALFDPGDVLADGVTAVPMPGHTVGHTGFRLESGGVSALFWGDVIHDYRYQFARPDRTLVLRDYNPERVAEEVGTQQRLLEEASISRELIIGPHAPFPGAGYVRANGDGTYLWEPDDTWIHPNHPSLRKAS